MKYLNKSFTVAPGSDASAENWERTFGKKRRHKKQEAWIPVTRKVKLVVEKPTAHIVIHDLEDK